MAFRGPLKDDDGPRLRQALAEFDATLAERARRGRSGRFGAELRQHFAALFQRARYGDWRLARDMTAPREAVYAAPRRRRR